MNMIKHSPITLNVPNRLIYSAHYYDMSDSVRGPYEDVRKNYDEEVAFMVQDDSVPLFIGEFGTAKKNPYYDFFIAYLNERPHIHWSYWPYNGYKESKEDDDEPYGLYMPDFKTVRHPWKLSMLQKVQTLEKNKVSKFTKFAAENLIQQFQVSADTTAKTRRN